jgi:hypothetical protein
MVLGSLHQVETFPGQLAGESLNAAKARLGIDMLHRLDAIVRQIHAQKEPIAPEVVRAILTTLFATYDVYDFPQYDETKASDGEYKYAGNHSIPEVEHLINILTM